LYLHLFYYVTSFFPFWLHHHTTVNDVRFDGHPFFIVPPLIATTCAQLLEWYRFVFEFFWPDSRLTESCLLSVCFYISMSQRLLVSNCLHYL